MLYILLVKDVMRGMLFLVITENVDKRDILEYKYMNDTDYELIRIFNFKKENIQ